MNESLMIVSVLLASAAAGVAANALRRHQRPFLFLPVLTVVLAVIMFFAGPELLARAKNPIVPPDLGGAADFHTRWQKDQAWYGEPFAFELPNGIPTLWTSNCVLEAHREISDPYWATQCGNAGLLIAQHRGVKIEPGVPMLPVISAWLATQNIDPVYWVGRVLTRPIRQGDSWIVYTDKTILQFPGSSLETATDPSSIRRLPAGTILYEITHNVDPEDPWTPTRKMLLIGALVSLFVGLVGPSAWTRYRGNDWEDAY